MGQGEPRVAADYAAMRRTADSLEANVIAFQEAENLAAAARVFDPARYTIVMESRPGEVTGTCGGKLPVQPLIGQAVGFASASSTMSEQNDAFVLLPIGLHQPHSTR